MKTAVVTGGSSGIGKATAKMLAGRGYNVYELSRHGSDDDNIKHIFADVTDEQTIVSAFKQISENEESIDLLVNNAGFGISGTVEFTAIEDAKKQFDVNFFGCFICSKVAIPYLRKSHGRIINISSVAAFFSIPYQGFYSASKSAINSLSLCMANELRDFGITVSCIMPGDVKTGFTASRRKNIDGEALYGKKINNAVSSMEKDETGGMSPDCVARVILKAVKKKNPAPFYTAGGKYKLFMLIGKLLPQRPRNYLVGKIYG